MKNLFYLFLIISFSVHSTACFKQKTKAPSKALNSIQFAFASKDLGKKLIVKDEEEKFFDRIELLDVAIQMQRPLSGLKKDSYVKEYKGFLKESVLEFSAPEKERMRSIMLSIQIKLNKIKLDLDLKDIVLIKTTGAGYGSSAFFTRENTIVIPEEQLSKSEEELNAVMLHEIFHIYSRYNKDKIREIYKMIGFQPIDSDIVIIDPILKERLLLNPDGLNMNSYITLTDKKGSKMMAIPLIYSTYDTYKSDVKDFFTYLKFDLYRLEEKDGKKIVLSKGISTDVSAEYFESFFKTIADNTQYIIHPDEIMADNFMLMVEAYALNDFSKFSTDGKSLIHKLYAYLSDNK